MPRNGSGTYSLPEPPFVPNTPISSSSVNSDFSDIGSALSASVAADGQTPITGSLKGYAGSVSLPGYSFSNDTNTGVYRIGADNLGVAVGGTKIIDVSLTGVSITGTFAPTSQFLSPDGTVLLPEYSFASDPDCGLYRIGANNLGVAVNAAKVLDISASGLDVVGTISQNGAALSLVDYAAGMINGTIVESHTGNAVTFAIKTLAGTDPSSTDPVTFVFRDTSVATGGYVTLSAVAATSITISAGSTLGFTSGVAGKLWGTVFNDGGTLRMGVINCLSGADIYPLGQVPVASSTAEGGSGGADSAQVFYTGTAVSSKAYIPIFAAFYESGLATAGSWNVAPTKLSLYSPYLPLPGAVVQRVRVASGTVAAGTAQIPYDNSIPQIGEGDQYLSKAITPTSACHLREIDAIFVGTAANNVVVSVALFVGGTNDALAACGVTVPTAGYLQTLALNHAAVFNGTSAQTISLRAGPDTGGVQVNINGNSGGQKYGGVSESYIKINEVVT